MLIRQLEVAGVYPALVGMRLPMESFKRSDTVNVDNTVSIGENDLILAKKLIKGGSEHRKFARQIQVWLDVTASQTWWSQFDTYKIGTTANSTSKMHKIMSKEFVPDMFATQNKKSDSFKAMLERLNALRDEYLETKSKETWQELIDSIPMSWQQNRIVNVNFETLYNICRQRKGHKLNEWKIFIDYVVGEVPFFSEFFGDFL